MSYIQGFLIPVKTAKKDAYRAFAVSTAPLFMDHGATRLVECWGDDVRSGSRTDMKKAVSLEADEAVVFSWIAYPDKATFKRGREAMLRDERMRATAEMPFDGRRMVHAGFDMVHETGHTGPIGYVDGVVAQVPGADRAALATFDDATSVLFREVGATRLVSGWSTEIRPGEATDFLRAVDAEVGAAITFGWMEWPDKATRDAGMSAMMKDERMRALKPAWDGPTAIFGGFVPFFDSDR